MRAVEAPPRGRVPGGIGSGARSSRERLLLVVAVAFVLLSFAANSVLTRFLVGGSLGDPGVVTLLRFSSGAVALGALLAARGRMGHAAPTRSHLLPIAALGSYALLISYGYQHIGAAAGTFVFYACVLASVTLGGAIRDRRAPARLAAMGGALALAGVGLLVHGRTEGTTPLGVLLLAGTGISWGAYNVLGRGARDPLAFTAANFGGVTIAFLVLAPAVVGLLGLRTPALTAPGLAGVVFMGVVTTALSYVVWIWVLGRISLAQAGAYQLAIPPLAGGLAVLLLDEPFTATLAIAGSLVVAGMGLAARAPRG